MSEPVRRKVVANPRPALPLGQLIQSACYAASTAGAVFCRPTVGNLSHIIRRGLVVLDEAALARAIQSDRIIDDCVDPASLGLALADGRPVGFAAIIPAQRPDGSPGGVLVVVDDLSHPGLSPAQSVVLSTHALQLAMSTRVHRGVPTMDLNATERLRLLESVVVHANDAVMITTAGPLDLPGPQIVYCNAAFTAITGWTEAEMLGKTPRVLQAPETSRADLDKLRRALQAWEPVELELLNMRKDGTRFWVELSIVPVADARGVYTHWVSVQRDVSHRKHSTEIATRARGADVEWRALQTELQARKRNEEQLLYTAFHDDLTGMRNRPYLMQELRRLFSAPKASTCALLFLDLDRFKLVNDTLGHVAGDQLLREIANRLRQCVRPIDTLARVGGDEFAILIEDEKVGDVAQTVADRIIEALRVPIRLGQNDVFTSCSVGIAFASGQYQLPEDLLRDADIAMYDAKATGTGLSAIFDASMHAGAAEALELQIDLRHAVARGAFDLHYQPIFRTDTREITSVEALIRWNHPTRGNIPPETFIGVAEDLGLVRDIGRWVLREACRQMVAWHGIDTFRNVRLSVNISSDELRDRDFVADLQSTLEETGFTPGLLQIEITESVFLHNPEAIGQILSRIRALGVRIALGDFGTGYSSLGYLDRFEIDTLKIDRSFVARMLPQPRTMAILQSLVRLGRALDFEVVAEGVEDAEQMDHLISMQCGFVQGYYLSPPLTRERFAASMRTGQFSDSGAVPALQPTWPNLEPDRVTAF